MSKEVNIAIIIPCYNEQENILALYNELIKTPFPEDYNVVPIFVNDCSTDDSKNILKQNNIVHIDLSVNLGIGGAMQAGFKYALKKGFSIGVQMDGDGQHPPSELVKVLGPIFENRADVVIGSRYVTREGFQSSMLRRMGINYFKNLNKWLTGTNVSDSTSGYRALNKKGMELVCDYYPDEYPEPESIVLFALNGLRILEVPVLMRERKTGKSSIRHYKTVYYMFKVTLGTIFLYIRLKFNGKHHFI